MPKSRQCKKAKHLKDWHASGRTQVDYCREHNLSRHPFRIN
ncbi:IS66 family insertion sequence element accessory protein TnpA [Desulfobulbus alkaliphilus]